ncbi:MAG: GAF domain-containing sensor histidine kinase [Chloroflexi bacterium]|nr:GAF domain-containing sensor histidine kinase [Chloroflexota bacterium]
MSSDNHPQSGSTHIILSQLKDIASAVMYAAEAGDLEQVLERIAQVSKDLVNARYAALGVPDAGGKLKYFKFVGVSKEQIAQMAHLPVGRGLLGTIINDRKAVRLERMQDDPRSVGFCPGHPYMTSLLGVPIQVGQQLFGILYLCDREDGQPFSEQDEWLIETMAGYAALAIAGSQLGDQQRRLALLEERERIGMELHDGVIQSLYAIGMHLDLMRMAGDVVEQDIQQVIDNLNTVIGDIRRYIMNLQTSDLRQKTIYQRLADMITRLHIPESLQIQILAPDDQPLFTPATFEAICQMANEALSNAVRHANARTISISTRQKDNLFEIVIADDGQGFDPEGLANHNGLGLRNLQQRAALHGGRVHIETAPGAGTRLTISIPLRML